MPNIDDDSKSISDLLPPIPNYLLTEAKTLEANMNKPKNLLLDKLLLIYDYITKFNIYIEEYASCSKGCSHCCCIDVQISQLEADLIYIESKSPYEPQGEISIGNTTPCPFLSNTRACNIYTIRPLACRMFHAFGDPSRCRPGNIQIEYGSPATNFGNIIFSNLVEFVHKETKLAGGSFRDIRDYF